MLHQLVALKVLKESEIQMSSEFFNELFRMYEAMGDSISIQYGGSIAHHANMGQKKKGLGLGEVWTSIKRHISNVVSDPGKQKIFNLFLGIFKPFEETVPIWNQEEQTADPTFERNIVMVDVPKWYLPYLQGFENTLPDVF